MNNLKMQLELNSYKPLREIVFELMRESILSGRFAPGERLMETQLAEEIGVSRTPVREAIRKLELEGLVVMVPRRGAYVADLSVRDISETFEIRSALEGLAAKLAVEKITEDEFEAMEKTVQQMNKAIEIHDIIELVELDEHFHDTMIRASHNERLIQMISLLREQIKRFRKASLSNPERQAKILGEHQEILESIASKDSSAAQRLVEKHIANAEESLLNVVKKHGSTVK